MGLKIICGDHAFCWLNRATDKRKETRRRLNFTTKEQSNEAGKTLYFEFHGIFWEPDWAPSGRHFLFTNWGSSPHAIEDRSAADGFSRRVAEAPEGKYSAVNSARWAPDGTRFLFTQRAGLSQKQLMVADAAVGHRTALAELNDTSEGTYA